jgi:[ribosomal protein S5]-alanine N-acetyltransferase
MRTTEAVVQDTLTLRPLTEADITDRYLAWFGDDEVTKYLEVRSPTKQESIDYLRRGQETGDYYLYAIIVDGVHIGNLKIGPIQWKHGLSDLVTVIGDRKYWGKGYATEAIKQGIKIAFDMGIRKISAGIYSDNIGSYRAYIKAGFTAEAILKDHYIIDGNMQGRVCVSIHNPACK